MKIYESVRTLSSKKSNMTSPFGFFGSFKNVNMNMLVTVHTIQKSLTIPE